VHLLKSCLALEGKDQLDISAKTILQTSIIMKNLVMKNPIIGLAAASFISTATAAVSGTFDVLTMNVAGLPAILNSNDVPGDKTTNAATIGTYFAQYDYDMIHMQEVG
jgi:hypothetical protein